MHSQKAIVLGDAGTLEGMPVAWLATHSKVCAVEFRLGEMEPIVVRPADGVMAIRTKQGFQPSDRVEVTIRYDGAPPGMLTGASADAAKRTTLDHFETRRLHAHDTKDALLPHRLRVLRLDEQTHTALVTLWKFNPGENATRRRDAINHLTKWLWGYTLRRGAAWAHDLDPRQPTGPAFDADVAYLSELLLSLLGTTADVATTFELFANGQLVCPDNVEQGGPDGANFVLFAAFALVAAGNNAVPAAQRARWRELWPCLIGTLEVFTAGYRAPATQRLGRSTDFAVVHRRPKPFDAGAMAALRARYAAMDARQLTTAFDRWVATMLAEDVRALGA